LRQGLDAAGVEIAFGNRRNCPPRSACRPLGSRAKNMLEGMVMFLAAVLAAQMAGKAPQAAARRNVVSGHG